MVNIVSSIIFTEGHKNVSTIYNKLTCDRHRSSGSRFLGSYTWDDTLSKKDSFTKNIEDLDFHNSDTDGNKPIWSHCVATSHYRISGYSLPLNFKLYLSKESLGNKAKKLFRNKQELAMLLIDDFVPVTEVTYLLIDVWHTSGKVMLHALKI